MDKQPSSVADSGQPDGGSPQPWIPKRKPLLNQLQQLTPNPLQTATPEATDSSVSPTAAGSRVGWLTVGNVVAGLSVGAYLIPQAMAYGTLAGIGAAAGLAAAVVPLILYTLMGTHRFVSVGPESAVALMAGAGAAGVATTTGYPVVGVLALMAVLAGVILIVARLLKAAFLADLLSTPVLLGYLAGVAVLMVLSQAGKLLDVKLSSDSIIEFVGHNKWGSLHPQWSTLALGLGVTVVCWVAPKVHRRLPGPLLAIAVSIPVGAWLGAPTIGAVASGLPTLALPALSMQVIMQTLPVAVAVAAVAYADLIVNARAFGDGTRLEPNREIVALAGAQLGAGLFGGYPMSASSSRAALARLAGATSKHYSFLVAVMVIAAPLLAGGVMSRIPTAALAGVVVYAAITLVHVADWVAMTRLHKSELVIALLCAAIVITAGILYGVGVAIVASVFVFLSQVSRPNASVLGFLPATAGMHAVDRYDEVTTVPGLVVFRYEAPLFFINASDFYAQAADAVDQDTHVLLVNMEATATLDSTSLDTIRQLALYLRGSGVGLWFARAQTPVISQLDEGGALDVIGADNMYPTLPTAVQAYRHQFHDGHHFNARI